ncbi:hypothetical protein H0H81_012743 [Sphagnurus paluster]|uniref:Uncharacterized protein n=1 Tax=Sphagnurus paluster TaxID=117069 RepID=A0A9P7GNN0_9AGAR|nr:hypothetical protein H0H81_012743 [Sphagnurus paluster]
MPKSPSPVLGPSRHPNQLPSPPPMDEDREEPPQHDDGPAPTDKETDGRPPAESDNDIEMVDEEPEPKERRGPKPAAQDKAEDDDGAKTVLSPNKQGEKQTLEDDDTDEDAEELAGHPKPCCKRTKKSVPVVEDSDAEVEVPAPAALREPKPRKLKAKGSRQERWATMSPSDWADLAVAKAKCSLVLEKPKGKSKGKGKGKATEEPRVVKPKGKKPKKTETGQCLPSLTEPYPPTSASALAWGAPAEFFALDVQGLPTPHGCTYEAVRFWPVDLRNTVELWREQVELENWDKASVRGYQQVRQDYLDTLGCIRYYQWQRTMWAARWVENNARLNYLDNHWGTGMVESDPRARSRSGGGGR